MALRIGIELSPAACRLVELEGKPLERGVEPATRVHAFAVLPRTGPEIEEKLRSLRRRAAAVVIWGAGSDHHQVVVNDGAYDSMRGEALQAARAAGVETNGRMADIAPAATRVKGAARQPVVLALASARAVSEALQPLRAAGVRIHSVVTPADALTSLARTRQAFAAPGGIEVYIALEDTVTCIALVRDGALVSARELPWGYRDQSSGTNGEPSNVRGEDIAARLAEIVTGFVAEIGASGKSVTQVSICGSLPNLRTMTVPLMERLDVEVETLDSLFGIDAERLPDGGTEFRERAAEFRLAWAAGAAGRGAIDFTRSQRQRARSAMFARAAVVAGVAAGLGAGLFVERTKWGRSSPPRAVVAAAAVKMKAPTAPSPKPAMKPEAVPMVAQATPAPPPAPVVQTTPPVVPKPVPVVPIAPALSTPAPKTAPIGAAPIVTAAAKPVVPVEQPRPVPAPVAVVPVATNAPVIARRIPAPVVVAPVRSVARGTRKPALENPPVPFEAALASILYSADRRLAIIDGRIVGPGDEVKGARILDITPNSVLLRDEQGRLRSLTLGVSGR